jgi:hypothetical protein
MPDAQIHPIGDEAAPADYIIPPGAELLLKGVYARFNGTGAGSPYLPLVRIISDADSTVIEAVADTTIAAGASADASWFPHIASKPATASGGIRYGVDNVGNWLEVETTGQIASAFSQPSASRFAATNYGEAFNADNGTLFTVPPDSFFNSGNPVVDVEDYKSSGDFGAFGQLIQVQDNTAAGTSSVTGEQIIAGADGTQDVTGEVVAANMGAAGTADALGVTVEATNQGSGKEIAVTGVAGAHKSGANALCFCGVDGSGNHVFEVYANGNIHIKTGATVTANL